MGFAASPAPKHAQSPISPCSITSRAALPPPHPHPHPTAAIKFLTYEQLSRKISHYLIDQGGDGQLTPLLRLTAGAGACPAPACCILHVFLCLLLISTLHFAYCVFHTAHGAAHAGMWALRLHTWPGAQRRAGWLGLRVGGAAAGSCQQPLPPLGVCLRLRDCQSGARRGACKAPCASDSWAHYGARCEAPSGSGGHARALCQPRTAGQPFVDQIKSLWAAPGLMRAHLTPFLVCMHAPCLQARASWA